MASLVCTRCRHQIAMGGPETFTTGQWYCMPCVEQMLSEGAADAPTEGAA